MHRPSVPASDSPQSLWRTRRLANRPAVLGLMAIGMLVLAACGQAVSGGGGGGGSAPDFAFNVYQGGGALDSQSLRLSDLRGQPLVINFWAGLCPPCRAELPDLQAFYDDVAPDATLVSVDIGRFIALGSQEDALDLLEELDITYPAAYAIDDQAVRDYRILSMPTTVFITAEGDLFRKWSGPLDRQIVTDITREMLSQT